MWDRIDPNVAAEYIAEGLNAKTRESIELPRGTGSFEIKQRENKSSLKKNIIDLKCKEVYNAPLLVYKKGKYNVLVS